MNSPKAWLLLAVSGHRQHGGNSGYLDQPDTYYSWDSTVPNHAAIQPGHRIALWDKRTLLGCSVIQHIETGRDTKIRYRCPSCNRANIKKRVSMSPSYRCHICEAEFDDPDPRETDVTTYQSRHDVAWTDLSGLLDAATMRGLAEKPASQLSLRPLDWIRLRDALNQIDADLDLIDTLAKDIARFTGATIPGGHRMALVRARRGQAAFRHRLLQTYGAVCAITGPTPPEALEAAHLYSYATIAEHHDHGGMLLRRDIHHLFDRGRITINDDHRVTIHTALDNYSQYSALVGKAMVIRPTAAQTAWLSAHHRQHRAV